MMKRRKLSIFGCRIYNILLKINNTLFKSIKKNTNRTKTYEKSVIENVKKMNVDGVICGHIHSPKIKNIDNFIYCNCGDFTENFTALIENLDGKLEIVYVK
jgi:UDP-2,3-diacylglucosamine pyrophosphatase LpxH